MKPVFLIFWLPAAVSLSLAQQNEEDERAFRTQHFWKNECASCHGQDGHGYDKTRGPAIAGLPEYYVMRQVEKFRAGLRGGLEPEEGDVYAMHRETVELTDELFRDLAAYVAGFEPRRAIHSVAGDIERGKQLYANQCAECHGADAEGDTAKESPPLHGFQDWYVIQQIQRFKTDKRQGDPKNPDSVAMHEVARQMKQRDIRSIAAFVTTRLDGEPDAQP